jgi:hypothetical protein
MAITYELSACSNGNVPYPKKEYAEEEKADMLVKIRTLYQIPKCVGKIHVQSYIKKDGVWIVWHSARIETWRVGSGHFKWKGSLQGFLDKVKALAE